MLLAVGLACATVAPPPPPPRQAGYRFVSTKLGVAVELPSAWRGYERREDLPEALRNLMPSDFGPIAMIAVRQGDLASARILSERALGLSTLDYFQLLLSASQDQYEILDAAYSRERETVRWRFRGKVGATKLTFVETIAVRSGHAVRVGFWSPSPLASYFAPEFESITAGALLFEEESGWASPWQDVSTSLDPSPFRGLLFAAEDEPDQAPECERPPQGLLWKVPTEHGTMFLFPSFHVGHPDLFPLPAAVESAFADAQRLAVEVDVRGAKLEELAVQVKTSSAAGAELRSDQRAEVERRLATFGASTAVLDQMPPWGLAMLLEYLESQAQGYYEPFGVDRYFLDRASDRKVIELESAEAQLALFEQGGDPLLDHTLAGLDELAGRLRPMIASWYCGGPDAFAALTAGPGETPMAAELQKALLDDRNRAMVDRLEPLLDEPGVTFVTVGLAHFLGPAGLPALLAERGHVVEGP
jgi:uncharacterized protein YbaP (TraB family)